MVEEGKREQLLVTLMAVLGKMLSKRVTTETIKAELMQQPTPTRQTKMMECRVTMRRLDTLKSVL
jgi:hypothetical protein